MAGMSVHAEIATSLRRAVRNGSKLHLSVEHARALLRPPFYALLASLEAEELNALCQQDNDEMPLPPLPASNSASSGCGIERIAMTGRSVGLMDVQRAAEALVSEEALKMIHQKKPSRP